MNDKKNKNLCVYGIFPTRQSVEAAVEKLKDQNFRSADVSVLFAAPDTTKEFAHTNSTKAPEGAVVGGSAGAVVGGTLGWLAGIGSIAIPGFGPFIAAGPLMGLLAGAGAGGVLGGVSGALLGLGLPEYEAKRYAGQLKKGGIPLSVHADDSEWREKARKILKETGAEDISTSEETSADYNDKSIPRVQNY